MTPAAAQGRHGARVEIRGLSKTFRVGSASFGRARSFKAVDNVSFTIEPGRTTGLIGESGSGKTTVARMITRLTVPDAGQILIDGEDILNGKRSGSEFARRVQIVFQDPTSSLNPRWTVQNLIAEGMRVHKLYPPAEIPSRVATLAGRCGLAPDMLDRYPHEFSGGQRQRIAIARALAVEPGVVVLDEPVSALDVSVQAQILVLLQELQASFGLTYLLIAHDLAVVERFCDQIVVMRHGVVVESGDPSEVHRNPHHPYTRELIEAHPVPNPHLRPKRPFA